MDVFQVHQQLLADYEAFTAVSPRSTNRGSGSTSTGVANGDQWLDAYLSLNPGHRPRHPAR